MVKEIFNFIRLEFIRDNRNSGFWASRLLYLFMLIFLCYLAFGRTGSPEIWTAVFWITQVFFTVNIIGQSFSKESGGSGYYYHTLVSAQSLITGKMMYNGLQISAMGLLGFAGLSLTMSNPMQHVFLFLPVLILGNFAFSGLLTLVNGISFKSANNQTLSLILGLPLILPMMVALVTATMYCISNTMDFAYVKYLGILLAFNGINFLLAFILFPYLWRD